MTEHNGTCPYIDITVPSIARIHDYLLGGKDHFGADRQAAEELKLTIPRITESVCDNRAFLRRAVRHLATRMGIRQFIDIGLGLPTQGNTHEVAQDANPDARIVYVGQDRMAVTHSRALLARRPGVAAALGNPRDPDSIFASRELHRLIDLDRPTAVLLVAVLHCLEDPLPIVARVRELIAPGSYLAIAEADSPLEVEHYFTGMQLLNPGIVDVRVWRPELDVAGPSTLPLFHGGVGHKPLPWAVAT
ncbi:SAM-dependent methyltransferase [Nonomuraea sp. NPDC059194]|uniref:SAM-dependent methyltransferase n=1 Tax=Nonomuraea sp. NPDC059194 TaxID=3346764 RepID=UPI00369893A0